MERLRDEEKINVVFFQVPPASNPFPAGVDLGGFWLSSGGVSPAWWTPRASSACGWAAGQDSVNGFC